MDATLRMSLQKMQIFGKVTTRPQGKKRGI